MMLSSFLRYLWVFAWHGMGSDGIHDGTGLDLVNDRGGSWTYVHT